MQRFPKYLCAAALFTTLCGAPVLAEESTLKEGAKEVGHAVGTAAREVGHGTREVTRKIGHATRDAAKEGVQAVKEGGHEFKRAVKGES